MRLYWPPCFWGGNAVVGRFLAGSVPPVTISATRLTISVLVFTPFVIQLLRQDWEQAKRHWGGIVAAAITGVIGYNLLIYWALNYTTAINARIINSTSPLFYWFIGLPVFKGETNGPSFSFHRGFHGGHYVGCLPRVFGADRTWTLTGAT